MSKKKGHDSIDDSQDTFIAHLVELRNRLLKAVAAVLLIFIALFLYPGPAQIYDFLAQPMLTALPQGTRMIATGVITPFMVPIKVTLLRSEERRVGKGWVL